MPPSFEVTESVRHLEDKLAEIRTICRLHACPTGAPENLVDLPSRLSQDAGLRADIADIVRSLQRTGLHLPDVLDILVLAVGGDAAPRQARQMSEQLSLLGGFLSNIGRWPGTDSAPILAPGEIPANIHKFTRPQRGTPESESPTQAAQPLNSQAAELQPPIAAPADSRTSSSLESGVASTDKSSAPLFPADSEQPTPVHLDDLPPNLIPAADIGRALARLERGNLELRAHLESIDQRISRMEPLLELYPAQSTPPSLQPPPTLRHQPPAAQNEASLRDRPLAPVPVSGSEEVKHGDPPRRSVTIYEAPRTAPPANSIPNPSPVVPRFSRFSPDPSPAREQDATSLSSPIPNRTSTPAAAAASQLSSSPGSQAAPMPSPDGIPNTHLADPALDTEQTHRWTQPKTPGQDHQVQPRTEPAPLAQSRPARQWPAPQPTSRTQQPDQASEPAPILDDLQLHHRPESATGGLRAIPLPRGFFGTEPEPDPTPDRPQITRSDLPPQRSRRGLLILLFLVALALAAGAYFYLHNLSNPVDPTPEPSGISSSPAPRTSASQPTENAITTEGPLTSTPSHLQQPKGRDPKNAQVLGARGASQPTQSYEVPSSTKGFRPAGTFVPASVMDGRLLAAPLPEQPRVAANSGLRGMVILEANISPSGQVEDLNVLGGNSALRSAAIGAVRNWRYKPYVLNGSPVEVRTIVRVDFSEHKSQPAQPSAPFPR